MPDENSWRHIEHAVVRIQVVNELEDHLVGGRPRSFGNGTTTLSLKASGGSSAESLRFMDISFAPARTPYVRPVSQGKRFGGANGQLGQQWPLCAHAEAEEIERDERLDESQKRVNLRKTLKVAASAIWASHKERKLGPH